MTTPTISIVVPVHNVEPYIDRCVNSIKNQTISDIEIILVENLSTDNSLALCNRLAAEDLRIKVLTIDVADLSTARNAGVKVATAPYIGFVDSDDWIEPDMFQSLLDALRGNNATLACCNYIMDFEDGSQKAAFDDSGATYTRTAREVQRDIIMDRMTSAAWVRLYPRGFFNDCQFPEGHYFEDHSTMYRWMGKCDKIAYVDRPLYHYFMRSNGICSTLISNPRKVIDYFYAEYGRLQYIEENDIFTDPEELIDARTYIIKQSVSHLKTYMSAMPRATLRDTDLKKMRAAILECLRYSRAEIRPRTYKKLRRIAHLWPLYYITHRNPNSTSSRNVTNPDR